MYVWDMHERVNIVRSASIILFGPSTESTSASSLSSSSIRKPKLYTTLMFYDFSFSRRFSWSAKSFKRITSGRMIDPVLHWLVNKLLLTCKWNIWICTWCTGKSSCCKINLVFLRLRRFVNKFRSICLSLHRQQDAFFFGGSLLICLCSWCMLGCFV